MNEYPTQHQILRHMYTILYPEQKCTAYTSHYLVIIPKDPTQSFCISACLETRKKKHCTCSSNMTTNALFYYAHHLISETFVRFVIRGNTKLLKIISFSPTILPQPLITKNTTVNSLPMEL